MVTARSYVSGKVGAGRTKEIIFFDRLDDCIDESMIAQIFGYGDSRNNRVYGSKLNLSY